MRVSVSALVPVFCGVVLAPLAILLHECAHYLAGWYLGFSVELHAVQVTYNAPQELVTKSAALLFAAAGPCADALVATIGFISLWLLRRGRKDDPANLTEWIATFLALVAGRWLRCFTGTPSNPQPTDEAFVSAALGFPNWLLPYALSPVAFAVVVAVIRMHPRGSRLIPFSCVFIGGLVGAVLWARFIGPLVLP